MFRNWHKIFTAPKASMSSRGFAYHHIFVVGNEYGLVALVTDNYGTRIIKNYGEEVK